MQQPADILTNDTTLTEVKSIKNSAQLLCPKCSSAIVKTYYEPQCLQCGYVDYSTPLEKIESPGSTVVGSATRYMVRYKGHSDNFKDKLAHVHRRRKMQINMHHDVCLSICVYTHF